MCNIMWVSRDKIYEYNNVLTGIVLSVNTLKSSVQVYNINFTAYYINPATTYASITLYRFVLVHFFRYIK